MKIDRSSNAGSLAGSRMEGSFRLSETCAGLLAAHNCLPYGKRHDGCGGRANPLRNATAREIGLPEPEFVIQSHGLQVNAARIEVRPCSIRTPTWAKKLTAT